MSSRDASRVAAAVLDPSGAAKPGCDVRFSAAAPLGMTSSGVSRGRGPTLSLGALRETFPFAGAAPILTAPATVQETHARAEPHPRDDRVPPPKDRAAARGHPGAGLGAGRARGRDRGARLHPLRNDPGVPA